MTVTADEIVSLTGSRIPGRVQDHGVNIGGHGTVKTVGRQEKRNHLILMVGPAELEPATKRLRVQIACTIRPSTLISSSMPGMRTRTRSGHGLWRPMW
jgi:hypothetical protein